MTSPSSPLTIAIIGAGFSGTAFAAACHRLNAGPLRMHLFEKTGCFGLGDAYRTPYPYHLLNVNAKDMSAFEDEPLHFVHWLQKNALANTQDATLLAEQFMPRCVYGSYLQTLLKTMQADTKSNRQLILETNEVIDIIPKKNKALLILKDQQQREVDKVVLALGNNLPAPFPFTVSADVQCIANPWDYTAPKQIKKEETVLIVGTGLSMIDTVLTLHHQQHRGKIIAVSRHGLLPLPHAKSAQPYSSDEKKWPADVRSLTHDVREQCEEHRAMGGDWRSVIHALRQHFPRLWMEASVVDKKRFIRHVLPYWNIHRHRVHHDIANKLQQLSKQKQLEIVAAKIIAIENKEAILKLRHSNVIEKIKIEWLINCMGPSMKVTADQQPLIHALLHKKIASLDALQLGFNVNTQGALQSTSGEASSVFYAIGALTKGASWGVSSVPELRKQCFELTRHFFAAEKT